MKSCIAGIFFVLFFYGCSGYGVTFRNVADVMAKLRRHQKQNEVKAYISEAEVSYKQVGQEEDARISISEELRLVGGSNDCEGRLESLRRGLYRQACDSKANNAMARVVCRELDCNPTGAQIVNPVPFGVNAYKGRYNIFSVLCNGSETKISKCPTLVTGDCGRSPASTAIAIRCGRPLKNKSGPSKQQ